MNDIEYLELMARAFPERKTEISILEDGRLCIKNGSEVIIIPISLEINISDRTGAHANLLIYRKNTILFKW